MNDDSRAAMRAAAAALRAEAAARTTLADQLERFIGDAVLAPALPAPAPQPRAGKAKPAPPPAAAPERKPGVRTRIDPDKLAALLEQDLPQAEIARRLGASQAGVSHAIKRLEQKLGA